MKMIAFYNNKGGVGKTSTAINIAYTLSRRKNRVLLIDFDGQCNSSRFFTDLANDECGCESAIVNAEEMPLIKSTRYDNIDIVTSSVRMNSISNDFANLSDEEKQTNIIKFRQSDYDYIIVDMPPAMNDFTEHVLTVCDYVYVPIELGTFAVQGLARVTQKIANAGTKYACFASKYDKGNKADRELLEIMKKNLGDKIIQNDDGIYDKTTEIFLTKDEINFLNKNFDRLGFSYLLSVSSDSDKLLIENIISKIKGEKTNGKGC